MNIDIYDPWQQIQGTLFEIHDYLIQHVLYDMDMQLRRINLGNVITHPCLTSTAV